MGFQRAHTNKSVVKGNCQNRVLSIGANSTEQMVEVGLRKYKVVVVYIKYIVVVVTLAKCYS